MLRHLSCQLPKVLQVVAMPTTMILAFPHGPRLVAQTHSVITLVPSVSVVANSQTESHGKHRFLDHGFRGDQFDFEPGSDAK